MREREQATGTLIKHNSNGHKPLTMVSYFNILATLLTFISLGFLLASMGSWSDNRKTLEDSNWLHSDNKDGDAGAWFGLKAFTTESDFEVYEYRKCDFGTVSDLCDKCNSAGKTTLSMLATAWITCLFNLIMNGLSVVVEGKIKYVAVVSSVVATLFTMGAFAAFMGSDCRDSIKDLLADTDAKAEYGTSSSLVIASLCVLVVSTLCSIFGAIMGRRAHRAATEARAAQAVGDASRKSESDNSQVLMADNPVLMEL
ncbi:hypothetical protein B484DRAFT_476485 [Ochromonadaceae sp. CCMP2298]|nr:hypothetical protein B484DRAFT_476485 [Ochromonadaceae sp. CCMP2298]